MRPPDRPIVIGLGELLWDVFPDSRRPGGAPANVAFHAQQLGCRGLVASCVGQDELGDELRAYLDERGLDTSLIQSDADHPTGARADEARANVRNFGQRQRAAGVGYKRPKFRPAEFDCRLMHQCAGAIQIQTQRGSCIAAPQGLGFVVFQPGFGMK